MVKLKPVGRPRLETARKAVISVRLDDKQAKAFEAVGGAKWLREFLNNNDHQKPLKIEQVWHGKTYDKELKK